MSGPALSVRTLHLDLPATASAFARRLHEAGVPVTPERTARFAEAVTLVRPVSRRRLYWTARATFVTELSQVRAFDAAFAAVFGGARAADPEPDEVTAAGAPAESGQGRPVPGAQAGAPGVQGGPDSGEADPAIDAPVAMAASDEEVLRSKHFDALEPAELARIYRLMSRLDVATPRRRTRRAKRERRGEQLDMRRTLRGSMRTAGDPIGLARRRRRVVPRRIVMLCDISGSMEPYARAYLQFLSSAAGSGPNAEAFAFATRLTRLTRALRSSSPERAIQRAAAAAPDWSSGTRIGDALRAFIDRHGRRGMARGAIVVILSDGWERGDPALLAREMERLSRLAHRIVWVNPRVAARGFSPRAGGMAAALPWCDAVLSGHSLDAMGDVIDAIASDEQPVPALAPTSQPEDDWASATPIAGSSVAMPSGYGPSRGRTTPGWGHDGGE
jgi:uncharacterized protein